MTTSNNSHSIIPYGPPRYDDELFLLESCDFNILIDDSKSIEEQFYSLQEYLGAVNILTSDEIQQIVNYWNQPHREENLGQVFNRLAWLIISKGHQ